VHYETPVPFGQDRLIPIWVATLALRQKSRTVHFDGAVQMLDFFRFPKDGRYYRRIVQAFQRIFASTIFFGTEDQPKGATLMDWARFHFFDELHLWFTEGGQCAPIPAGDHSNTVTLSEAFYSEIDQHRIPMEREIVIALANSPGVLDFYIWIAWRSWVLKSGKIRVPLFSPGGLKEQLGCHIHPEDRFLRRKISQWLRVIRAHWPQCPAEISADGESLIISSSKSIPALHPAAAVDLCAPSSWISLQLTSPFLASLSKYPPAKLSLYPALKTAGYGPALMPCTFRASR